MCDFRAYTGKAFDRNQDKIVPVPSRGQAAGNEQIKSWMKKDIPIAYIDKALEGVYQVCATGAHYAYSDGEKWYSCYDNERYIFLFEEGDTCLGHSP